MLITFCFGFSSNLSQQKSPTAEILRIYFLRTIFRRKYMHKISTVGLFCCDKFEETPKQKVINMSKLNKLHFSKQMQPAPNFQFCIRTGLLNFSSFLEIESHSNDICRETKNHKETLNLTPLHLVCFNTNVVRFESWYT